MKYTSAVPNATRQNRVAPASAAATAGQSMQQSPGGVVDDYAAQLDELRIEMLTVPGFIRRVPHQWHLNDIQRYGDRVGRMAEALQLSYITKVDRLLGMVRVFPIALLRRVYDVMAAECQWPAIIDAEPANDDAAQAEALLRANAKADRQMVALMERTDDVSVLEAIQAIRQHLEAEAERLQAVAAASAPGAGNALAAAEHS